MLCCYVSDFNIKHIWDQLQTKTKNVTKMAAPFTAVFNVISAGSGFDFLFFFHLWRW